MFRLCGRFIQFVPKFPKQIIPLALRRCCSSSSVELPNNFLPRRTDEPIEVRRKRLIYQSRHRGMLEGDLLLSTFAAEKLAGFNEDELRWYDELLNLPSNDWDIFRWATSPTEDEVPDRFRTPVLTMLRAHAKNAGNQSRLRMPNLEPPSSSNS